MFFNIAFYLIRFAFFPLYRIKVQGRDNLPKSGGMLVCVNHTSLKDPIFVVLALGRKFPYAFMAKAELFKNSVFGFILKNFGAFPVNRGKADIRAIKNSLRALKDGKMLIVFPEGTRVAPDAQEDADVKSGAGMLAVRGGAPVVPVYLSGKKRIFSKITVIIGEPYMLYPPENPDYKEIANGIMTKVRSLSQGSAL